MESSEAPPQAVASPSAEKEKQSPAEVASQQPAVEVGGRKGPEPTRYGDWEKNGRCIDF